MKKGFLTGILLLLLSPVFAHVGSSGVVFQGTAGDYRALVEILPPDVIPGTARITVYLENGNASRILARPIYFRSGDEGAPSADPLDPVAGQAGQFQGVVWLMEGGSSSVQILIEGDKGTGELIVPVVAASTAERDMPAGLGWSLSALALLLVILMVSVIGASASDGLLRPGEVLSARQKRRRWVNMGIALAGCILILYGGGSWWDSWAQKYRRHLYKPMTAQASVLQQEGQRTLQFRIDTTNWNPRQRGSSLSYLIPDHGKLMHLFLVRSPGLDAFAHLHPERVDSTTFQAHLPSLPAGKYLLYGDIVYYSGYTETLTDTIDIPEAGTSLPKSLKTDPEDTYVVTDPLNSPKQLPLDANAVICGSPGIKTYLKDSSYIVWEGDPKQVFEAGKPYQLRFEVYAPDDTPARLQSYLGMGGHAAVIRSDGSVYIHLHPVGTVSMASEMSLRNRIADTTLLYKRPDPRRFRDSIDRYVTSLKRMPDAEREALLMKEMKMEATSPKAHAGMEDHGSMLSFPYSFPKAGNYRIFLQIKRNGHVLTGIFDARVRESVF